VREQVQEADAGWVAVSLALLGRRPPGATAASFAASARRDGVQAPSPPFLQGIHCAVPRGAPVDDRDFDHHRPGRVAVEAVPSDEETEQGVIPNAAT
jgi:hypothetical protein